MHLDSLYNYLSEKNDDVEQGDHNGRPALTIDGDPFVIAVDNNMAFRLIDTSIHDEAWALNDSDVWDPDENPDTAPQLPWIKVTDEHTEHWQRFAEQAMNDHGLEMEIRGEK